MNKEMIVNIDGDGTVSGLHFDEFPLSFLGKMKVGRASEIFFNEETQKWDVKLPDQDEPLWHTSGFDSYEVAREFEVAWLQGCMKKNVSPTGAVGLAIAARLRGYSVEGE